MLFAFVVQEKMIKDMASSYVSNRKMLQITLKSPSFS